MSTRRLAALCVCLFVGLGAFASVSSGSSIAPGRATAPKLIAHDRSRAAPAGPQLLREARSKKRVLAGAGFVQLNTSRSSSDIGRAQFLVAANGWFVTYSRASWERLGAVTAGNFWAGIGGPDDAGLCATSPQAEPAIAYDWQADRWVVTESAFQVDSSGHATGAFVQCVAVSSSPDATGTWNRYVFKVSTSAYPGRVALGVWPDGYYLSFNEYTSAGDWLGAGALAVERSQMLLGRSAQSRYLDLSSVTPGLGGMLPADLNGANPPTAGAPELYLQAHDDPLDLNDRFEVWAFHVDWSGPATASTFRQLVDLPLDTGGFTLKTGFSCVQCIAQSGGAGLLPDSQVYSDSTDALPLLGGRLQWGRSPGGNEFLAAALTVNASTSTTNLAAPMWVRLTNVGGAGWTIGSKGIYNPAGSETRYLPSVATDNSGDVGLAFVRTGAGEFPTTAYTDASDPSFGEQTIDAGTQSYTADADFGRGTSLSLDPVDLCTFWFSGPAPDTTLVSITHFAIPGCVASTSQPPVVTADPSFSATLLREGQTITGAAATFTGAAGITYQWQRCDSLGVNCIDIPGANGPTRVMDAADAAGDRTLRFEEIASNTYGSSRAVSTSSTLVQSIPPENDLRPVISGTALVGQTLTSGKGTWTSSSPLSYTYLWRRCAGPSCSTIAGATTSSYTLTSADLGDTIDVVVSAKNTGGSTDADAVATSPVAAASSSGGGTGGTLNLSVTGSESPAAPAVGGQVLYALQVNSLVAGQLAQKVILKVTLPAGVTYVSSQVDRGPGCTLSGTSDLSCDLDFLSDQARVGHVSVWAKVNAPGPHTLTATVSAQQTESTLSDNTLTLTDAAAAVSTTTSKTASGIPSGLNGPAKSGAAVDRVRPTARAIASSARRGKVAKIRFRIYDNSGIARVLTTITRHGRVIGKASTGFGPVAYGRVYYVAWHVPKKLAPGKCTFTVVAADRARHKSRPSRATLTVRR